MGPVADGAAARRLKAALLEELSYLPEVERFLERALAALERAPEDEAAIPGVAVAGAVADAYLLMENVLKRISQTFEGLPTGADWHRELLDGAAREIEDIRPPVLGRRTRELLHPLRSFRHVVRNVYGTRLRPDRVREVAALLPETVAAFREDLESFLGFLDTLRE